uniref:SCP domain-containing protein n=1 Tax=Parastrongyloides trichosuri TaxID=131310 RepID=A0A0N4ZZE4_PARTI
MKLSFKLVLIYSIVLIFIVKEVHSSSFGFRQNTSSTKKSNIKESNGKPLAGAPNKRITTRRKSPPKNTTKRKPQKSTTTRRPLKSTTKRKPLPTKVTSKLPSSTKRKTSPTKITSKRSTTISVPKLSTIPTPPVPGPPSLSPASKKLFDNMVIEINKLRKAHGSQPLKFQIFLFYASSEWAEEFASKYGDLNAPFFDKFITTSLASFQNPRNIDAKSIVQKWYNQGRYYNYEEPVRGFQTSSFTAMLWKNSKEIGCATANDKRGDLHIICKYLPEGNVFGEYRKNVLRPI